MPLWKSRKYQSELVVRELGTGLELFPLAIKTLLFAAPLALLHAGSGKESDHQALLSSTFRKEAFVHRAACLEWPGVGGVELKISRLF